jgi:hypothetical protein
MRRHAATLHAATLLAAALLALPACATAQQPKPPAPAQPAAKAEATPADTGEPVTCTGTLSGAVKGTFTCRVTAAIDGGKVSFTVEALDAVAGVRTLVPASFELAMPLRQQSYGREAVTAGTAVVELTGGARYTASARRGEVSLVLESAERYAQARNFYVVSGTLSAHLVGDGQARGEVVVDVRF